MKNKNNVIYFKKNFFKTNIRGKKILKFIFLKPITKVSANILNNSLQYRVDQTYYIKGDKNGTGN